MALKEIIARSGEGGFDVVQFRNCISNAACKKLHVVDVYTSWCGPCLALVPTFKNLQVTIDFFEDRCTVTQIDRASIPEFAERFPETSKPRFLFFKGGEEVKYIEGLKAPEILQFIQKNLPPVETDD
mmetsp:Transcript_56180/g.149967  ORF Transcript_56180/g.149967 Transcript_56180/m.149967 type:complete len:127 (-) Transcript_56180:84-464(-)